MTALFGFLLKVLGQGVLAKVLEHLRQRRDAATERERLKADVAIEAIRAEIASRQAARDMVIAEQGWWVTALIRPLFAYPLIVWWAAVIADSIFRFDWDIAALPRPLDDWAGWIVAAYFVTRPAEKIARGFINRSK